MPSNPRLYLPPFMNKFHLLRLSALLALALPASRAVADTQTPVSADFAGHNGQWQLNLMEGTQADASSETVEGGKKAIHITVPVAGAKRYFVQLVCKGISLQADKTYRLHVRVRSKPDADLAVVAGSFHGKFEELWRQDHLASKDGWTEYNCDIKPGKTDSDAQISLSGLAGVAGDYWFADVSISEGK